MALNTFKCNHPTPLHFKGLMVKGRSPAVSLSFQQDCLLFEGHIYRRFTHVTLTWTWWSWYTNLT